MAGSDSKTSARTSGRPGSQHAATRSQLAAARQCRSSRCPELMRSYVILRKRLQLLGHLAFQFIEGWDITCHLTSTSDLFPECIASATLLERLDALQIASLHALG